MDEAIRQLFHNGGKAKSDMQHCETFGDSQLSPFSLCFVLHNQVLSVQTFMQE